MKNFMFGLAALALFAGCDAKGPRDGTIERATAESEAQRDVENKNLIGKAAKMEADLTARHRFYSALEGKFEGNVMVDREAYKMRLVLLRSLPEFVGDRTRQLSEIESDLNNLFLNVQIVQWHPSDPDTAVGCRISQVRPNMNSGTITFTSTECPSAYTVYLSEDRASSKQAEVAVEAAARIKSGEEKTIGRYTGTVQPSWNAKVFTFDIKRVN